MLISGRFRWISPAGCSCRGYGAQYELYGIASCRWLPAACLRSADASCICPFAHCNRRSTVCREWKQSCELRLPLLHLNSLRTPLLQPRLNNFGRSPLIETAVRRAQSDDRCHFFYAPLFDKGVWLNEPSVPCSFSCATWALSPAEHVWVAIVVSGGTLYVYVWTSIWSIYMRYSKAMCDILFSSHLTVVHIWYTLPTCFQLNLYLYLWFSADIKLPVYRIQFIWAVHLIGSQRLTKLADLL
jgi:hypothetical protein